MSKEINKCSWCGYETNMPNTFVAMGPIQPKMEKKIQESIEKYGDDKYKPLTLLMYWNICNDCFEIREQVKEMMLTGGSPTMHPALVNELTHFANERNILITIETEGSHYIETDFPLGLISLSPKFSNSVPVVGAVTPGGKVVDEKFVKIHNRKRMNTDAIKKMIAFHKDYHFKPVWDGTEKNLKEIEEYRVKLDIPKHKTYIMPAGDTRKSLIPMYVKVFEMVAEHGYNMTGRDHIIAYDTERGV